MTRAKASVMMTLAFWLGVSGLAAAYLTAPGFAPLWRRKIIPWYHTAVGLILQRPDAGWIAARHARQAILTRTALAAEESPGARDAADAWFARWDRDYLAYQRRELRRTLDGTGPAAAPCVVGGEETPQESDGGQSAVRLMGAEWKTSEDGIRFFDATEATRLEINPSAPVNPRVCREVIFPLHPAAWSSGAGEGGASGGSEAASGPSAGALDDHVRVIWIEAGRRGFSEEQSVLIPLGSAGRETRGLRADLSRRWDWLGSGPVGRFVLLFRVQAPIRMEWGGSGDPKH
ncbi:MAG: hypothetical protein Kow0059_07900 [Candidatus Sumerlaeia bacterium]